MSDFLRALLSVAVASLGAVGMAAESSAVRKIDFDPDQIPTVRTRVKYNTILVLPEGEEVVQALVGNPELWRVDGGANILSIKPGKEGDSTSLAIVGRSGEVYQFLLQEVGGGRPGAAAPVADLKVVIRRGGQAADQAAMGVKIVPASELAAVRAAAGQSIAAARAEAEQFRAELPTRLFYDYEFKRGSKPFRVTSIWNDGRFTYVQLRGSEKPVLYEVLDGKPNIVNYEVEPGPEGTLVYVAPKVIERGYLAAGKSRLDFVRGK